MWATEVGQEVANGLPFPAGFEDAYLAEDTKMVGEEALLDAQADRELTDEATAIEKGFDDGKARWLGKSSQLIDTLATEALRSVVCGSWAT